MESFYLVDLGFPISGGFHGPEGEEADRVGLLFLGVVALFDPEVEAAGVWGFGAFGGEFPVDEGDGVRIDGSGR